MYALDTQFCSIYKYMGGRVEPTAKYDADLVRGLADLEQDRYLRRARVPFLMSELARTALMSNQRRKMQIN